MQISHPKQCRLGVRQLNRIRWANDSLQPPTLVNTSLIAFSGVGGAGRKIKQIPNQLCPGCHSDDGDNSDSDGRGRRLAAEGMLET